MRVIGTAGHVDHGKSTLIQALTGIDPDRLREEKERGMTIDLGFAWLKLPNGTEVSMVDVPGHERFIHNMLAGVGGVDIALLVIAADEGVMPQTREHVAILDLLGIQNGVVALTKCDLVDQDWLELVQADVEEYLAKTSLAGAPIVPCSSITGVGLPELRQVLQDLLARERSRPDSARPRLPIDRVFTVAGFGTVVTGTLLDGELRLGQELEVQPGGLRTRVRGLQTHRHKMELVPAGTRCAVNVVGVAVEELRRGQVLAEPGTFHPTRALDAHLRLITDARPLAHNTEVTFHSGAAESPARVTLLDRDELEPGQEAWVQIRLQDEVAVAKGDLFILRLPSPSMTIGGGSVVEPHARRHRRRQETVLSQLAVLASGTPEEIVLQRFRSGEPAEVDLLARGAGLPAADVRKALEHLLASGDVILLGERAEGATNPLGPRALLITPATLRALTDRATSLLTTHHASYPLRRGLPREELRTRLGLDARAFVRSMERLVAQGVLAEDGPYVRLASHTVRFTPQEEAQAQSLLGVLREAGVAPPDRSELEADLGINAELVEALLAQGRLVEVSADVVYDRETLDELVSTIRADVQANGPRTVAQLRDALGASRKFILALLTYTDQHRITRRIGDNRVLY